MIQIIHNRVRCRNRCPWDSQLLVSRTIHHLDSNHYLDSNLCIPLRLIMHRLLLTWQQTIVLLCYLHHNDLNKRWFKKNKRKVRNSLCKKSAWVFRFAYSSLS